MDTLRRGDFFALLFLAVVVLGCSSKPQMRVLDRDDDDEEEQVEPAPATVATAAPPNDSSASPEEPPPPEIIQLTPEERRRQSLANMQEIARAMTDYAKEKGHFPSISLMNAEQDDTVSWRVELLPYLGYGALYRKFRLDMKWNDPSNSALLAEIPDVYRIPGRTDDKCSYLALVGNTSCFTGTSAAVPVSNVLDGIDTTLLIVEVNDPQAGPWTQPDSLQPQYVTSHCGALYGGFLAIWADGRIGLVPSNVDRSVLSAAMTISGREQVPPLWEESLKMSGPLMQPVKPESQENVQVGPVASTDEAAEEESSSNSATGGRASSPASLRAAEPTIAEQRDAKALVKELFLDRYQAATNNIEKQEIARDMVARSSALSNDLPGKYVLLSTAQRIAMESNDLETAEKALSGLLEVFELDDFKLRISLLKKTESLTQKSTFDTRVMDEARDLMEESIKRDDFDSAASMADVAVAAARRINAKADANQLSRRRRDIDKMRAAYHDVQAAVARVGDPSEDPAISEVVGRYYALMKGEWEKGLVHLARGEHADLRRLAQLEIEAPTQADKQLALADGWYAEVTKTPAPEDYQVRRRALHWYQVAARSLPAALPKLKAELRMKELLADLGERSLQPQEN